MKKLEAQLSEIEDRIKNHQLLHRAISGGSVGWHIEHALLTINMVIKGLNASNPDQYSPSFNLKRIIVTTTGKIPRGRVKAPEVVQPGEIYNDQTLLQHLLLTKKNVQSMDDMDARKYFTHPFLGDFRLKPTRRFLQIHTNHHLAIINDIVKEKDNK